MAGETVSPASSMDRLDTSTSSSSQPVQDSRESESDTESETTVSRLDRLKSGIIGGKSEHNWCIL